MNHVLKITDVYKSFGSVKALNGLNMEIKEGEIHCLAGENGSGKSTIIKIISGVYAPDSGLIEICGEQYAKMSPIKAIMSGVQVIYQDFSIFPNLTVFENMAYNTELAAKKKLVSWKRLKKTAEDAAAKIHFHVDFDALVRDLSVADKQLIAICRALMNNAKLIIMDEPTTALAKREIDSLFKVILELKAQGISTLFVSHKLDEVFEISDTFTIIRNGENAFTGKTSELDEKKFSYYMTGKEFSYEKVKKTYFSDEPVLQVSGLSLENAFYDINLSLYKGEILGISGLLGSGRTELALALFGALKPEKGEIRINGRAVRHKNIPDAVRSAIGYVPEDRLTEGLFLERSIAGNMTISKIDDLSGKFGVIHAKLEKREVKTWIDSLSIATPNPDNPTTTLSGGNQQRVVLAKWLSRDLDVLVLNGPTVGVDIGSKFEIHQILREYTAKGLGIIVISDDVTELTQLCDKVLIMKTGKITAELDQDDFDTREAFSAVITANIL